MGLAELSDDLAALVARARPAIASLSVRSGDGDSSGSGFLVDDAGSIVTNHHVVDGMDAGIDVELPGWHRQKGQLVGSDPLTDLAVVRIDEPPPRHLALREVPARLGELCIGIGSPLGMYPESAAIGVVSGLARTIPQADGLRPLESAIQTDVAINPGNSGGPLLDARGDVLGVITCTDIRAANIGFAIPADTIAWVTGELRTHGSVVRAALGVAVAVRQVTLDGHEVVRLAVSKVGADHPAGGLRAGDVILSIEGELVDERTDLYRHLTRDHIGRDIPIEVLRDDRVERVNIQPRQLGG